MYKDFTDNKLISLYRENDDEEAFQALLERYKEVVKGVSRAYFLVGGDGDDLFQEGLLGFLKAVRTFSEDGGASFKTFAHLCIESNIKTAVKKAYNKGNIPLNNSVSLSECFGVFAPSTPEDKVLGDEAAESFRTEISEKLSDAERKVLECYLKGLSYAEIASVTGGDLKRVDNALQRIRKKIIRNNIKG